MFVAVSTLAARLRRLHQVPHGRGTSLRETDSSTEEHPARQRSKKKSQRMAGRKRTEENPIPNRPFWASFTSPLAWPRSHRNTLSSDHARIVRLRRGRFFDRGYCPRRLFGHTDVVRPKMWPEVATRCPHSDRKTAGSEATETIAALASYGAVLAIRVPFMPDWRRRRATPAGSIRCGEARAGPRGSSGPGPACRSRWRCPPGFVRASATSPTTSVIFSERSKIKLEMPVNIG
jgi:hypothetical protein